MSEAHYEKQHLKNLSTYICNTMALIFTLLFIFTGLFINFVPMTGILDFPYFPSIVGISTFIMATIFSVYMIQNLFGKLLLVINIGLMLILIFLGP
ncbi:MAG: hypothetical protein ACI4XS_05025 [Bacillus sp. (in: firmicutes)]